MSIQKKIDATQKRRQNEWKLVREQEWMRWQEEKSQYLSPLWPA